jgi:hypothetical protein
LRKTSVFLGERSQVQGLLGDLIQAWAVATQTVGPFTL